MKTSSFIYALSIGAFLSAAISYAENVSFTGESSEGLTWSGITAWDPAAPGTYDTVTVTLNDAQHALSVDGAVSIGRLNLNGSTWLQVSGAGNSLATNLRNTSENPGWGDIVLGGNTRLEVTNGASVNLASGSSFQVGKDASLLVDASTITGQFYGNAYNVTIQNGSTWNVASDGIMYNGSVLVKDSTVNLTGNFKMSAGMSGGLVLDNSRMGGTESSNKGINFGGRVDILNGSTVSYVDHFNVGRESGNASGDTTVTVRGTEASRSSVSAQNAWLNVNDGGTSRLVFDGYSDVSFTTKIDINKSNGGNFYMAFQNSGNNVNITGGTFGSKSDGTAYQASSGEWKIYTAEGAANNTLNLTGALNLVSSTLDGHSVNVGIDWSGETNVLTSNNSFYLKGTTAAGSSGEMYLTVRDGASLSAAQIYVGGDQASATSSSGTASLNVLNGAKLQVGNIYLNNSYVAHDASTKAGTSVARATFDGVTVDNADGGKIGTVFVGGLSGSKQDSGSTSILSGTSIFELKNRASIVSSGGMLIGMSNSADSVSASKVLVNNSSFVTSGEIKLAHSDAGNLVAGGKAVIEVSGTNSVFESTDKGFFSGYNTEVAGGSVEILMSGTGNRMGFATGRTESNFSNEQFYMFASGNQIQTGGTFDVKITGSGNTFETTAIQIGKLGSTGGANTFYVKGSSSASDEMNRILLIGPSITVRGSSDASSTISNAFIMDGNTVLRRSNGQDVTLNIGSDGGVAGGTARFVVSGSNNTLQGYDINLGSTGGGNSVFRVEGYAHNVSFSGTLNLRGVGSSYAAATGGRLEFVLGNDGVGGENALISAAKIGDFSGAMLIDFNELSGIYDGSDGNGKFLLISSSSNWEDKFNAWYAQELYKFDFRDDEGDSASLLYENGNLYVLYTSSVPEPAACAAVFGALAFVFAAYVKRKR